MGATAAKIAPGPRRQGVAHLLIRVSQQIDVAGDTYVISLIRLRNVIGCRMMSDGSDSTGSVFWLPFA